MVDCMSKRSFWCEFTKSQTPISPNRPTFRYFSWWTALLGIIANGAMMFVISPTVAGICIILLLILIIILHLQSPSEQHQWGSISQALIFHQVCLRRWKLFCTILKNKRYRILHFAFVFQTLLILLKIVLTHFDTILVSSRFENISFCSTHARTMWSSGGHRYCWW